MSVILFKSFYAILAQVEREGSVLLAYILVGFVGLAGISLGKLTASLESFLLYRMMYFYRISVVSLPKD